MPISTRNQILFTVNEICQSNPIHPCALDMFCLFFSAILSPKFRIIGSFPNDVDLPMASNGDNSLKHDSVSGLKCPPLLDLMFFHLRTDGISLAAGLRSARIDQPIASPSQNSSLEKPIERGIKA
jgi:hypothetical protein